LIINNKILWDKNLSNLMLFRKKSKNITEPLITVSKFGIITFNLKLITELNLSEGTKVSFLQDKNNPKDWYLKIGSINGLPLMKKSKSNSTGLFIQYKELVNVILKSIDKDKTTKIRCSIQIHNGMYALLTNAMK